MAKNEIFKQANHLSLPVPADVPAGEAVRIGSLNGFTETPEGDGVGNIDGYASINMEGAFKVSVTGALTKGQVVYINPTTRALTSAAGTGNFTFGTSLTDKGAGAGLAVVAVAKFGVNITATA